ncbi:transposase [Nannocystis exedens]|nr:transposase [Nannocystis exedens]
MKLQLGQGQIVIEVEHDPDVPTTCPECGQAVPRHDTRTRRWRHLDTCQYRTIIEAGVPRTSCPKHGTLTMRVSWADGSARLTALFEALVIDWLRDAPIAVVAERLGLSWDQVAGVQERAVQRGLERREVALPEMLAVDETSFQRRHEYVTIVHDPKSASKRVIHVADGRGKGALKGFLSGFSRPERAAVSVVVMDMHEPYIQAVREAIPDGDAKIAFDKYHVAARLGQAVDHVRREEHRALHGLGDNRLKGTKYLWQGGGDGGLGAHLAEQHAGPMGHVVRLGYPLSPGADEGRRYLAVQQPAASRAMRFATWPPPMSPSIPHCSSRSISTRFGERMRTKALPWSGLSSVLV